MHTQHQLYCFSPLTSTFGQMTNQLWLLLVLVSLNWLCLLAFSAWPSAADGSPTESAPPSTAGAYNTDQQTTSITGWNYITAACPAVVPTAACVGPGSQGQAAGRGGPHPGIVQKTSFKDMVCAFPCITKVFLNWVWWHPKLLETETRHPKLPKWGERCLWF